MLRIFCCPRQLPCSAFTIHVALSTTQGNFAVLAMVTVTTMGSITFFSKYWFNKYWLVMVMKQVTQPVMLPRWVAVQKQLPRHPFMLLDLIFSHPFLSCLVSFSLPVYSTAPSSHSSSLLILSIPSNIPLSSASVTEPSLLYLLFLLNFHLSSTTHKANVAGFCPVPCA